MILPAFLFGGLLSTLVGIAFHVLRGGNLGRLFLDILLAWLGFWAGQWLADRTGWTLGSLGTLHLVLAILGSLIFLAIGNWLSKTDV